MARRNLVQKTVTVRFKEEYGFSPKAYKSREVPIPDQLIEMLIQWKKKSNGSLVFPTSGGLPNGDFLEICKAIAKRAGLKQDEFWLHKFRATFASLALWCGIDLRTVQMWMGHSDLESTMRYLKPNRSQAVRQQVNRIFSRSQ